jgi:hypothetical protein
VRNRFNVAIVELENQDKWQLVSLGLATVSGTPKVANQIISKVVNFIADSKDDFELIDYKIEIL